MKQLLEIYEQTDKPGFVNITQEKFKRLILSNSNFSQSIKSTFNDGVFIWRSFEHIFHEQDIDRTGEASIIYIPLYEGMRYSTGSSKIANVFVEAMRRIVAPDLPSRLSAKTTFATENYYYVMDEYAKNNKNFMYAILIPNNANIWYFSDQDSIDFVNNVEGEFYRHGLDLFMTFPKDQMIDDLHKNKPPFMFSNPSDKDKQEYERLKKQYTIKLKQKRLAVNFEISKYVDYLRDLKYTDKIEFDKKRQVFEEEYLSHYEKLTSISSLQSLDYSTELMFESNGYIAIKYSALIELAHKGIISLNDDFPEL